MARHDAKRVGAATGTSNISTPVPYWRTFLGGTIGGMQFLTGDADGDGVPDVVTATGGRVSAVDVTNTPIWTSSALGIQSFAAIADLDGDGTLDIVAYSLDHVVVFSLRTGVVEWKEPDGEMGTIGSVRVGDVTGDGKPDVVVVECGCCGANSGRSGFFWTFGSGFASATELGTIPVFVCGTYKATTLIQADTSQGLKTLVADSSHFALLGSDGSVLAQTNSIGTNTQDNACTTANIDGVPGDEAVCLLNSINAPATGQRRVTVLHYDSTGGSDSGGPMLDVLWSKVVAPDTGGDMKWVDPLVDLDGDGVFELVFSTQDPTNGWQTHIYDPQSGTELVSAIAGQYVAGTAAMETQGKRVLMTTDGTKVTGWVFARAPSPTVSQRWVELDAMLLTFPSMKLVPLQAINTAVTATDLSGSGLEDAIMEPILSSNSASLIAISGAGGNAAQVAMETLPAGSSLLDAWVVPPITIASSQIAVARSDGVLNLLGADLSPTKAGTPRAEVDVQFGGYYASGAWGELYRAPRVSALGGGNAQSVLVVDSRNALSRVDAASASWAIPPSVAWTRTHTFGAVVAPGLNGANPGIACLAINEPVTNPPAYRVRALSSTGTVLWDQPVTGGTPLRELVPGNFDGDGIPDLTLQLGDSTGINLLTVAYAGRNGSSLWSTGPMYPGAGGIQSAGTSVADWNGDGIDDVYFQGAGTHVLSGSDGSTLASGGPTNAYSLPLLYDTSGSGQDEIVVSASLYPTSLYSHDLATALWTSGDSDRPYPYATVVECQGTSTTKVLVEGSWQNPARLKMTTMNGSSLGSFTTVVLAGGQLYSSESAATAAGAFLGQLTAANAHTNLTGKARPTVVVGSADGWLYGVNPCAGTMDFSVQFGPAVGEAVFGDTDGDGNDEILVTAADGYLYDLKNQSIASPAYVWDTDPPAVTDHDVDSIITTNELSATWAAVGDAGSYQVGVVTGAGTAVSTPTWQSVGAATSTSLKGLPLTDNTKYFFAVRAISANGPSVDALSNGVTVHFPGDAGADAVAGNDAGEMDSGIEAATVDATTDVTTDAGGDASEQGGTGGGGGGCGCRTTMTSVPQGWLLVMSMVPLTILRRLRGSKRRRSDST